MSYTIIGAIFGLLGSFIIFTPVMRGIIGLLAGLFLVIYGISIIGIFPQLKKIRIGMPSALSKYLGPKTENSSPLIIGLLNGLMIACGPLQAMYLMAAGTGSFVEGAKLLFIFGLGTLPVMLGFGLLAGAISSKTTATILKTSGVLVIIIGLFMASNGLALMGLGYNLGSNEGSISSSNTAEKGFQEIYMNVTANGWEPDTFTLEKGIPVHWIINGKQITNCNRAIQVPAYNLSFDIKPGLQTIDFTPHETGTIRWSCWMGMIPGRFIVVEDKI